MSKNKPKTTTVKLKRFFTSFYFSVNPWINQLYVYSTSPIQIVVLSTLYSSKTRVCYIPNLHFTTLISIFMYTRNFLQISNENPNLSLVLRIVHIIGAKNESLKEKKDCRLATIPLLLKTFILNHLYIHYKKSILKAINYSHTPFF